LSQLVSSFFLLHSFDNREPAPKDYYPVVTSVKQISPDEVEIRRAIIYKRFYNQKPYPEEVIRVNRKQEKPQDLVFQSYCDFGFKEELTRLYAYGIMVKQMRLGMEKHAAFKEKKHLQLFSDIYMYKNLLESKTIHRLLDPKAR